MTKHSLFTAALAALAMLCIGAGAASAQVRTGNMTVRAQVNADCQLTTHDLDFQVYNSSAAKTATTTLEIRCTPGATASISFNGGSNVQGQLRRMSNGATNLLEYGLYKDAAYSTPIDIGGEAYKIAAAPNPAAPVTFTVYGKVPANQVVQAGGYTDVVVISVQF